MQSTQSSGTVFFRAVVMVGFIAVIFYAAVNGNALPDALRKQIEKFMPQSLLANKPASAENTSNSSHAEGDAPLFNASTIKMAMGSSTTPQNPLESQSAPRTLAMDGTASLLPAPQAEGMPPVQINNNPTSVVPVNYQAPAEIPSVAGGPFSQIQNRLKQMGATYYLLETWGNQQQLYRFYCKMAVGGNTNYSRCFEHISADPLQAMAEVLKQVEDWRNGGLAVQ